MAVTVLVSIRNSEVLAGTKVAVTAAFTNGGGSAVTIVGINRFNPSATAGPVIDDADYLYGLSLAAGQTTNGNFTAVVPAASNSVGDAYTLGYSFLLSDGTQVTPTQSPQMFIRNPNGLTTAEKNRLPPAGALDFRSNQQSGLFPVLFGIRPTQAPK